MGFGTDPRRRSCGEDYYEESLSNGEHPCGWDFAFDALAEAGYPNIIPTFGPLSQRRKQEIVMEDPRIR